MKPSRIFPWLLAALAACTPALADFKVGDTVVVVHDTKIKVGDQVLQEAARGLGLKVQAVQGDWLWVSNAAAGWVKKQDVASPDKAVEEFTKDIKKDPHDGYAYLCRGLAFYDKGELDIAIEDFNEAIRWDPKDASAYSSRSLCWWAKREVDKAIQDCSEAIRLDPEVAMYYSNRGILWNMKGEYERAIEDADHASRLAPHFVTPRIVRGNSLQRLGQFKQALASFDEALKINPRDASAYGLRGRVYATTGNYAQAMRDFESAITIDPKDKNALNELARFYATCPIDEYRNGKKAVQYAERACELTHWKWASGISVLAAAYAEAGDFKKAVEFQEQATDMVPIKRRPDYRARLDLYKTHRPYREEPKTLSGVRVADDEPAIGH